MPAQLAALNNMSTQSLEMTVDAALEGARDLLSATGAILSLEEIRAMAHETYKIEKDLVPAFAE